MSKKYFLKYKDTTIGFITKADDYLKYESVKHNANDLPSGLGHPLGLYPVDITKQGFLPKMDYEPSSADVYDWLEERIMPKTRQGIESLLEELGLSEYDVWEIAKATKAMSLNDFYWITDNVKDKFEDTHFRGESHKDIISEAFIEHNTRIKLSESDEDFN